MMTALPLPLAPQLLLAATDGGGIGDILLRMMDMLIQEKEGPEGSGRKNFRKNGLDELLVLRLRYLLCIGDNTSTFF
jgi:hypothetical protein